MCHAGGVDDVTWGALTLTLTALGGFYTWWAYRNRGATPALRGLALTLLPAAALLTGTLRMFTRIADAVADWATHLVFSPTVWLGVLLAGLSAVLFVLSGVLRGRGIGAAPRAGASQEPVERGTQKPAQKPAQAPRPRALGKAPPQPSSPLTDDGIDDEIAAILKRRGIS
jgi:hypothetical protein